MFSSFVMVWWFFRLTSLRLGRFSSRRMNSLHSRKIRSEIEMSRGFLFLNEVILKCDERVCGLKRIENAFPFTITLFLLFLFSQANYQKLCVRTGNKFFSVCKVIHFIYMIVSSNILNRTSNEINLFNGTGCDLILFLLL